MTRIGHIGLFVADPEASARWYADVLGMSVVACASDGPYKGGIFMSFGTSDHDIGLFPQSPGASKGKEFEHVGLELDCRGDLGKLQRFYGRLQSHKVRIHEILDHGVSKGIYFFDPDGHMLEVFCQQVHGPAAIAELGRNEGKAEPYDLTPISQ
ncbi:MAG: VOC family protein [Proteobacteria bacterium]|nr:VOC family protein [Pseudomonadota bacterium]